MVYKTTRNTVVFDQYHPSVSAARTAVSKSLNSQHGPLSKDYPDYTLKNVKLKPGNNPYKYGRRLYLITLVKRKKRKSGRVFI